MTTPSTTKFLKDRGIWSTKDRKLNNKYKKILEDVDDWAEGGGNYEESLKTLKAKIEWEGEKYFFGTYTSYFDDWTGYDKEIFYYLFRCVEE